jgi:hypothetical protein
MRTDTNELNIQALLANDINHLREAGKVGKKKSFFVLF